MKITPFEKITKTRNPRLMPGYALHIISNDEIEIVGNLPFEMKYLLSDDEKKGKLARFAAYLDSRTQLTWNALLECEKGNEKDLKNMIEHIESLGLLEKRTDLKGKHVLLLGDSDLNQSLATALKSVGVNVKKESALSNASEAFTSDKLKKIKAQISASDLVVLTKCNGRFLEQVNHMILECETPAIAASTSERYGLVGPLVIPNKTACFACFKKRIFSNTDVENNKKDFPMRLDTRLVEPGQQEVFLGLLVNQIINFLTNENSPLSGKVLFFDLNRMTFEKENLFIIPWCDACSTKGPAIQKYIQRSDISKRVNRKSK